MHCLLCMWLVRLNCRDYGVAISTLLTRQRRKSTSKTEVGVWDPWTAHYLTVCHTPSLTSVCLWAWCVCVGCANCRSARNMFRCTLARTFGTVTMMNATCALVSCHLTWVTCKVCAVLSCNHCCFFFFFHPKGTTVHLSVTAGKHTVVCAYLNTVYVHIDSFTPCTQEILCNIWCMQIDLALDNNQLTCYARRSRTGISLNRSRIHRHSHLLGVLFTEESCLQNQRTPKLLFCLGGSFDFRLTRVHRSGESRRQEKAVGVIGPQAPLKVAIPSLKCYLLAPGHAARYSHPRNRSGYAACTALQVHAEARWLHLWVTTEI